MSEKVHVPHIKKSEVNFVPPTIFYFTDTEDRKNYELYNKFHFKMKIAKFENLSKLCRHVLCGR